VSSRRRVEDPISRDSPQWYKDAIIYELHVRAFCDRNGDGVGDFRGLIQKLDYIQDLGVTALWLLPFYPSPLRDDGYDIADYTDIHPLYGNLTDFKAFLREAHRRRLRVITELVVNHTSDQHPWFQRARHAKPGSSARNFYVWSDTPDRYREARIIFKDFEPSNWSWDATAKAFYWHRFYAHQPDLNYDNPHVHQAIFNALDFWLEMGIDGLRLDAVPYLYEREGTNCENLPQTHQFLKELRKHVDDKFKDRVLLAEANQWPEDAVAYFGNGNECHMAFHFPLMPRLFMGIRMEDSMPILDILQQTPSIPATSQWALFLRNHDELTLEMVTDEDRDYMYRVYAQDPQARINLGIRRRLAPLLENHRGKIELMNGLLFSLPGTPVLYYGDEIGMGDNIYLGDRNGVRTPMQWTADRNAGFSGANPQRLFLPAIIDPGYHYEAVNVDAQQNNPHSLLWWTKRLMALRKRFRAFGRGTIEFLHPENHKVVAFVRRYQSECILVVANLSRFVQCAELDLSAFQGMVPVEMLGRTKFPAVGERPYFFTLGAHAFYWFSLEAPRVAMLAAPETKIPAATLTVKGSWEEVLRGKARTGLEELLPAYLSDRPWFCGKERQTEAAMILETTPFSYDSSTAHIALVQVEYSVGESETYLLPLAYATIAAADQIQAATPQAVICRLRLEGDSEPVEGILYDPVGERNFSLGVLQAITRHRRFKRAGGELVALPLNALRRNHQSGEDLPEPALLNGRHNNSSIAYGDRWLLKVYRRLEEGVHPEVEVGRFLAEKTSFTQTPVPAGMLEYRRSWGAPMTLALLETYVPHQASAWTFTRDALGRFFEQALMKQAQTPEPFPPRQFTEMLRSDLTPLAQETIGSYLETVRLLGQRSAEFHTALASAPQERDFAPEPFTTMYQRSLYQSLRSQTRQSFALLRRRINELPASVTEHARKLVTMEEELLRRCRSMLDRRVTALRTRCHGDYHLGQVLHTGKDFVVIDLEGHPSHSLSDRRRKQSPLRDAACMLRSFHYASRFALHDEAIRRQDVPVLEPWANFWYLWVSVAFLKAYLEIASRDSFLPKDEEEIRILLDFFLLKRAINELRYELTNHPQRVVVPVEGLLQIMEGGDG
jgi:maltose alpha-D-glucosyltransferase/alpha-amylase